jgi:hypothetical protein
MLLAFRAEVLWRGAEAAGVADAMTAHRDNLLGGVAHTLCCWRCELVGGTGIFVEEDTHAACIAVVYRRRDAAVDGGC